MLGLTMDQLRVINDLDGWKYDRAPTIHDLRTNGKVMVNLIQHGIVRRIGNSLDRFEFTDEGLTVAKTLRTMIVAIRDAMEKSEYGRQEP